MRIRFGFYVIGFVSFLLYLAIGAVNQLGMIPVVISSFLLTIFTLLIASENKYDGDNKDE